MNTDNQEQAPPSETFIREGSGRRTSFLMDFLYFLKNNKKWWLLPLVAILLLFGFLMFLSTTAVAPFIYTIF